MEIFREVRCKQTIIETKLYLLTERYICNFISIFLYGRALERPQKEIFEILKNCILLQNGDPYTFNFVATYFLDRVHEVLEGKKKIGKSRFEEKIWEKTIKMLISENDGLVEVGREIYSLMTSLEALK